MQGGLYSAIILRTYFCLVGKAFMIKKKDVIELEGVVKECLPDTKFLIEITAGGKTREVMGYLSGKMRMHYIRILEGDRVTVEVTTFDPTQGRITYRHK